MRPSLPAALVAPIVLVSLSLLLPSIAVAQTSKPAPAKPPAPKSAPLPPKAAPAPTPPSSAASQTSPAPGDAPVVANTCEYVEPPDASALLGPDATASTAPSKGALLSCGYTSPAGNALTVSIADYGIPSIAQQFFEKTWELTKTATVEDSLGTSAFALIVTDPPPPRISITAWKAEKIVTVEASGATLAKPDTLPALRAILVKLLPKLQPPPAPQP